MLQDLKKAYEELEEIFGIIAVNKVMSHISSLSRKIEDLIKSRDKWKRYYYELKETKSKENI